MKIRSLLNIGVHIHVPGEGVISTPEIDAERAEQKRLYGEYLKALANKD